MADVMVAIQARMGSTRLPGKVLKPLGDRPILAHVIDRCRLTGYNTVLTVPHDPSDDGLYNWALDYEIPVHRGPHPDVLMAMTNAVAAQGGADFIVRITADCPFIQPEEIVKYVGMLKRLPAYRYVSNAHPIRYAPKGLDFEVFDYDLMQEAVSATVSGLDREHVTPWMRRHLNMGTSTDDGEFRVTVDTAEDYERLQAMVAVIGSTPQQTTTKAMRDYFTRLR